MKNNILFLFFILLFLGCSQKAIKKTTEVKTEITKETTLSTTARISTKKMNVIFRGVINPFEIDVPGIDKDSVKVTVSQGKIRQYWASSRFEIIPEKVGVLNVFVTWRENQIGQRDSFFYRVKNCPDPIPYLSGKVSTFETPDSISVEDFRNLYGLGTIIKEFDFEAKCKIFKSETVRIQKNGMRSIFNHPDSRFSKKGKEFLSQAEPGDIFIFRKITCRCPGDEKDIYRDLMNFSVEIY